MYIDPNRPIIYRKDHTLVRVYYYIPDYHNVINEFTWQTIDVSPKFPRVKVFLDYWRLNIDAVIKEIELAHGSTKSGYNSIDEVLDLH